MPREGDLFMKEMIQKHKGKFTIVLALIMSLPIVFGETNTSAMTDSMIEMMVELMPLMLIIMMFKMMAGAFGGDSY